MCVSLCQCVSPSASVCQYVFVSVFQYVCMSLSHGSEESLVIIEYNHIHLQISHNAALVCKQNFCNKMCTRLEKHLLGTTLKRATVLLLSFKSAVCVHA